MMTLVNNTFSSVKFWDKW